MKSPEALRLLLAGHRMTRAAWPTGSWTVLRTGYPEGIHVNANTAQSFECDEGDLVIFAPYFQIWDPATRSAGNWTITHADLLADDWRTCRVPDGTPIGAATITFEGDDGHAATLTGDAYLRPVPGPGEMTFEGAVAAINQGHRVRRRPWPLHSSIGLANVPPGTPRPEVTADVLTALGGVDPQDRVAVDWVIHRDPPAVGG